LLSATESKLFAQEIVLNSTDGGPLRWSAGIFYRDAEDTNTQVIPELFESDYSDGSKSSAVFGELRRRFFHDTLEWTLGLRYFQDDVRTDDNFTLDPPYHPRASFSSTTPRAVLTWYPSSSLTVYGSYSEGFRSGAPQDPGTEFAAVKPDELRNYEVGAKADVLDRRLSFDAAVYYIDWRDVQQILGVPFGTNLCCVTARVNGESASGPGVDFAMTARPLDGLELGISFGWNDLQLDTPVFSSELLLFEKGDRLNSSAEYTAGASADYVFALGNLTGSFAASANYSSSMSYRVQTTSGVAIESGDDWWVARTSISLGAAEKWTATLFVDNLNNEQGKVYPGASFTDEWAPRARPRTMGVQLEYYLR